MSVPLCSDTGCITKKYANCVNIPASGPCADELTFLKIGGGVMQARAYGEQSVYDFPPGSGVPSCTMSPFPSGARILAAPTALDGGVDMVEVGSAINGPSIPACDGPVAICPACIFIQPMLNFCDQFNLSTVVAAPEAAYVVSGGSGACRRLWIAHLSCPWKGQVCVQFCCDDFYGVL